MSEKVQKFLADLSVLFPKRFEDERQQIEWFQTWKRALDQFDPWVIDAAVREIVDTRDERSFPLVAEVKKVCFEILRKDRQSRPQLPVDRPLNGDPYILADALIKGEMGRQAAMDNPSWILGLHDYCRRYQRLPDRFDVQKIKRETAEFHESYRQCLSGEAGQFGRRLEKLGASMLRKVEKLRRHVLGPDAEAA